MRILVTGGAGYIGSVITEELVRDGQDVVVIDNLSKGYRRAVQDGAVFVQEDLRNGESLRRLLIGHKIEAVVHMAAYSLVGESMTKPRDYYRNNVEMSLSLLNAMCDCGVNRIVFSSTAATYGEPAKQPIEESDTANPTNPYGETKHAFERALHWYSLAYGIRYTALRYFNAAGATEACGEYHVPESHLIPSVLQVALGKRPHAEVFGDDYPTKDGTCVRDYIHVVDLARAHILALETPASQNQSYNLGCGGDGYSVRDVIDVARKVTRHPIPERVTPRRPGDPAVLIASSEKIRAEMGWKPRYQDLSVMIETAWDWLRTHPNGY